MGNTKSIPCPYECEQIFKKPAHLQAHILTHTGERPFQCPEDLCESSFRRKSHLTTHLNSVHSWSTTSFSCPSPTCKSQFTLRDNLIRHERYSHSYSITADDPKPDSLLKCFWSGCSAIFADKKQQKKHIVELHSVKEFWFSCSYRDNGCQYSFRYRSRAKAHQLTWLAHVHGFKYKITYVDSHNASIHHSTGDETPNINALILYLGPNEFTFSATFSPDIKYPCYVTVFMDHNYPAYLTDVYNFFLIENEEPMANIVIHLQDTDSLIVYNSKEDYLKVTIKGVPLLASNSFPLFLAIHTLTKRFPLKGMDIYFENEETPAATFFFMSTNNKYLLSGVYSEKIWKPEELSLIGGLMLQNIYTSKFAGITKINGQHSTATSSCNPTADASIQTVWLLRYDSIMSIFTGSPMQEDDIKPTKRGHRARRRQYRRRNHLSSLTEKPNGSDTNLSK